MPHPPRRRVPAQRPAPQPPIGPSNDFDIELTPEEVEAALGGPPASAPETAEDMPKTLDECQQQLREARESLEMTANELAETMRALSAANEHNARLTETVSELGEENQELKRPPLPYGLFVGLNTEDDTADIAAEESCLRVAIHPRVERSELRLGTTVLLAANKAILGVVPARHLGRSVTVSDVIDAQTAIVGDDMERKEVVRVPVEIGQLETGSRVMVSGGFVIRRLQAHGAGNALGSASSYALAEMPDATFDDIGGLDEEVREILAALEDPSAVPEGYEKLRLKMTFSALFFGLPGNGKTTIAKAIARYFFDKHRDQILQHAKGNFIAVLGPEMHHHLWGVAESRLRDAVNGAQKLHDLTGAPVTLFFDDCESLFVSRGASEHFSPNMDMVNQFNTLIEGVRGLRGVNIIAATNRIDLMDPAVVARFGTQKRINPPQTPEAAGQVLTKLLRDVPFQRPGSAETVGRFVDSIFAQTPDNELLEIHFEDEDDTETIRLSQLLSGRLLRDVVTRAKIIAKDRIKVLPPEKRIWELSAEDLRLALDRELRSKEALPTTRQQVIEWFRQRGDRREIDDVINLREHRRMEEKRDRIADRRAQ